MPLVCPVGLLTNTVSPEVVQSPVCAVGLVVTRLSKSRRTWQRSGINLFVKEFYIQINSPPPCYSPESILLKVNMQVRASVDVEGNSGF